MRFSRWILIAALAASTLLAQNAKVTEARALMKDKKFEEAITVLEGAHKAAPKNDEVRLALAEAHVAFGNSYMYNDQLPPFRKYPSALKEFRKALTYDKDNKKATTNIATIESIYKSMGRPIPQ